MPLPRVFRPDCEPHKRVAFAPAGDPDWMAWARRHGLDPEVVSANDPIVCDDRARRITYLAARYVEGGRRLSLEHLQLESPAAAFPGGDPT